MLSAAIIPPTSGTLSGVTDAACTAGTPNSDSATVTFTPTTDFQGTGSFTFSAADTTDTAATTVTVTIGSTPMADAQSVTTDVNTSLLITLTGSDADSADCELTFAITVNPTIGTLGTINNATCVSGTPNTDSATVTFVPNNNAQGSDSFTFSVNDGNATTTATVTITVGAAPTPAFEQGDVDCDGDVDIVDALNIARHVAGLPVTQTEPCPDIGS